MFSSKELSTLVAGAEHEINVGDLQVNTSNCRYWLLINYLLTQAHTNYAGGYDLTHPTISAFWQVVGGLSEDQKRALLKFVTSCSRPPLLGFKVIILRTFLGIYCWQRFILGFGSSFLYSKFRIRFRKITNSFNLHESAETSRFQSKIACSLRKLFFLNTYFSGCSHFEE